MSPASALRSAKGMMRNHPRWGHPFFWAAFVLQGEYGDFGPGATPERGPRLPLALLSACALLLGGYFLFRLTRGAGTPRLRREARITSTTERPQ